MNDDYRELVVEARTALGDLIRASEPGTSYVLQLNTAYGVVADALRRIDAPSPAPRAQPVPVHPSTEAKRGWKRLDQHAREHAALEALGEGRRTVSELALRIPEHLSDDWAEDLALYYADVYQMLVRLMEAGEVDRQPGEVVKGRRVWRYFRRSELSGAIAEIAEQFTADTRGPDS